MRRSTDLAPEERKSYTIDSFCRAYDVGRTKVYEAIRRGEIRSVKAFGRTLIPASEGDRMVALPVVEATEANLLCGD
jgi:hypothetical protein